MKYLFEYNEFKEPKVGDYVVAYIKWALENNYVNFNNFITNNIGKIVRKRYITDQVLYNVEYDISNIDQDTLIDIKLEVQDDMHIDTNNNIATILLYDYEIEFFDEDKNKVEIHLQSRNYNV